jgi:hypothetical protein
MSSAALARAERSIRLSGVRFNSTVGGALIGAGYDRPFEPGSGASRAASEAVGPATPFAAIAIDPYRRSVTLPRRVARLRPVYQEVDRRPGSDHAARLVRGDGQRSTLAADTLRGGRAFGRDADGRPPARPHRPRGATDSGAYRGLRTLRKSDQRPLHPEAFGFRADDRRRRRIQGHAPGSAAPTNVVAPTTTPHVPTVSGPPAGGSRPQPRPGGHACVVGSPAS